MIPDNGFADDPTIPAIYPPIEAQIKPIIREATVKKPNVAAYAKLEIGKFAPAITWLNNIAIGIDSSRTPPITHVIGISNSVRTGF